MRSDFTRNREHSHLFVANADTDRASYIEMVFPESDKSIGCADTVEYAAFFVSVSNMAEALSLNLCAARVHSQCDGLQVF